MLFRSGDDKPFGGVLIAQRDGPFRRLGLYVQVESDESAGRIENNAFLRIGSFGKDKLQHGLNLSGFLYDEQLLRNDGLVIGDHVDVGATLRGCGVVVQSDGELPIGGRCDVDPLLASHRSYFPREFADRRNGNLLGGSIRSDEVQCFGRKGDRRRYLRSRGGNLGYGHLDGSYAACGGRNGDGRLACGRFRIVCGVYRERIVLAGDGEPCGRFGEFVFPFRCFSRRSEERRVGEECLSRGSADH